MKVYWLLKSSSKRLVFFRNLWLINIEFKTILNAVFIFICIYLITITYSKISISHQQSSYRWYRFCGLMIWNKTENQLFHGKSLNQTEKKKKIKMKINKYNLLSPNRVHEITIWLRLLVSENLSRMTFAFSP